MCQHKCGWHTTVKKLGHAEHHSNRTTLLQRTVHDSRPFRPCRPPPPAPHWHSCPSTLEPSTKAEEQTVVSEQSEEHRAKLLYSTPVLAALCTKKDEIAAVQFQTSALRDKVFKSSFFSGSQEAKKSTTRFVPCLGWKASVEQVHHLCSVLPGLLLLVFSYPVFQGLDANSPHARVYPSPALSWPSLLLPVLLFQTLEFANFSSPSPPAWSWVSPGRILPLANGQEKHHGGYGWKSLHSHSRATNLKSEITDINKIALVMLPAPSDRICPQWTCFAEADRKRHNVRLLVPVKPSALAAKEFLLRNSYSTVFGIFFL